MVPSEQGRGKYFSWQYVISTWWYVFFAVASMANSVKRIEEWEVRQEKNIPNALKTAKEPGQMCLFSENGFLIICLFTFCEFNCFYHCFSDFFSQKECILAILTVLVVEWLYFMNRTKKKKNSKKKTNSRTAENLSKHLST